MEQLTGILFIDIETVPIAEHYDSLTERLQHEWERKARLIKPAAGQENAAPASLFEERAGVFSEFAKVVCIGMGSLYFNDNKWKMRLKSLTGTDEKVLLNDFCTVVSKFNKAHPGMRFCGHNIKEFDIPFLSRRMIINGQALPECLQLWGKKPWEVTHIDTMDMWRFGDYKNFTSLSLLAAVLDIPSPKSDIDGSQVAGVFYKEKHLDRIGRYCLQDVYTSAKVYLRLAGMGNIELEQEIVVE